MGKRPREYEWNDAIDKRVYKIMRRGEIMGVRGG